MYSWGPVGIVFAEGVQQFERKEGIASRASNDLVAETFGDALARPGDQFAGLFVAEGLQSECGEVRTATPGRASREQFGPTEGQHKQRCRGARIDDMLDEIEQVIAGAVQIFKDDDV